MSVAVSSLITRGGGWLHRAVKWAGERRERSSLRWHGRRSGLVLVHQMGKVRSSSVTASLDAAKLGMPVCQTHFLAHERLARQVGKRKVLRRHLAVSEVLRELLDEGAAGKHWKVITLVRDPVARNVSGFFENIEERISGCAERRRSGALCVQDIIDAFLSRLSEFPLTWFDLEIEDVFDIDVYQSEFPKAKGYQIYSGGPVSLLLIKLEMLNECAPEAMREFLDIKDFKLLSDNTADSKDYRDLYRGFKSAVQFPQSYLDTMYGSKYAQHFYRADEIAAFRAKWVAAS